MGDDPRPLIPERDDYQAACVDAEIVTFEKFGKSRKVLLHLEIAEGEYKGTVLFCAMQLPARDEKGRQKPVTRGMKLYQHYCIANGNQAPKRRDRVSLNVFKHRLFRVSVRTAKPRFNTGHAKPDRFAYSVVDELLERLA